MIALGFLNIFLDILICICHAASEHVKAFAKIPSNSNGLVLENIPVFNFSKATQLLS